MTSPPSSKTLRIELRGIMRHLQSAPAAARRSREVIDVTDTDVRFQQQRIPDRLEVDLATYRQRVEAVLDEHLRDEPDARSKIRTGEPVSEADLEAADLAGR